MKHSKKFSKKKNNILLRSKHILMQELIVLEKILKEILGKIQKAKHFWIKLGI